MIEVLWEFLIILLSEHLKNISDILKNANKLLQESHNLLLMLVCIASGIALMEI